MLSIKFLLGSLATLLALASYVPYFRNIFRGRTKPHAFSWFVWGVLTSIVFAAQLVEHAGAGAWVTGSTALACFVIAVLAYVRGARQFSRFDWLCLLSAGIAVLLWWWTSDPTASVLLVALTDIFALAPTLRKGYFKPFEENITHFSLSALSFFLALFALETSTFVTWFYPATIAVLDGGFALLLVVRRQRISFTPAPRPRR